MIKTTARLKAFMKASSLLALLIFILSAALCPTSSTARQQDSYQAFALVSRHIKPYMDALDGLHSALADSRKVELKTRILDSQDIENPAGVKRELSSAGPDMLVSIGPEAARLGENLSRELGIPMVYTMVLNPDVLFEDNKSPCCGISLHIPVFHQLMDMSKALPEIKKVGLLFNPESNSAFFARAGILGQMTGLEIIPLEVSSSRQVPEVLEDHWEHIDALWMVPDRTVSSEALIEHIIKEALYHGKPVVGYNRFFYDSGAVLAFVLDYEQIGEQTAELALSRLHGRPGRQPVPAYQVLINRRTASSLGLKTKEDSP